jgi:hypothetical protein
MLLPPPDISAPYVDSKTGQATVSFYNWIRSLYDSMRGLSVTDLQNAANDGAAAAAGVKVGGLYRNGSVLMVRVV